MNKLIKRFFFPIHTFLFSSLIRNQKYGERKNARPRLYACTDIQQQQKREGEQSEKEKKEGGWAGDDVPHRLPSASQNIQRGSRARRPAFPWEPAPLSLARETANASGIQTSAKRQARRARHCRAGKLHQINTAENKRQDNFQPSSEAERKKEFEKCESGWKAKGRKCGSVLGSHIRDAFNLEICAGAFLYLSDLAVDWREDTPGMGAFLMRSSVGLRNTKLYMARVCLLVFWRT